MTAAGFASLEAEFKHRTSVERPRIIAAISEARSHPFTLKMAAIVITVLPIMAVYPFMQRFFVKGIALGSVKG